jgi:prophage maintenance system killer protein
LPNKSAEERVEELQQVRQLLEKSLQKALDSQEKYYNQRHRPKLKDRLLRAQHLLDRPLKIFANCVRCEAGNSQKEYVQDCQALWEAAARWVSTMSFNHALITKLTALMLSDTVFHHKSINIPLPFFGSMSWYNCFWCWHYDASDDDEEYRVPAG